MKCGGGNEVEGGVEKHTEANLRMTKTMGGKIWSL